VSHTQLLVPGSDLMAVPATRHRTKSRRLRSSDPAVRAMTDFLRDPPLTTLEECDLDTAMDEMFRLGVRAFLVVRAQAVVGLVTASRVAEVMTAAADMPAIDWLTLREAKVRDLMEIFEGANVHHLVVLETESTQSATVRGLVHRARVERRLHSGD